MRTKRAFKVKSKAFFIIFNELSVVKNCLRPESVPLTTFFILFLLFLVFFKKKWIHTNFFWFIFLTNSAIKLIYFTGYAKSWPKLSRIWKYKLLPPKLGSMNFILILFFRRRFRRSNFKRKRTWGCRVNFTKNRSFVEAEER